MNDLDEELADVAAATETALMKLIPTSEGQEAQIFEAMRYSAMAGGKRIRPFLVIASADLFNVARSCSERVAAAIEMIHTYSLIHDDLPAMDDDDLRRGMPACHIKFDEATAILAGDALLTLAFEVVASTDTHDSATIRCDLITQLCRAAGAQGMVGGLMLDLMAEKRILSMPQVTRLQRLKTGSLINCCCQLGAILGKASDTQRQFLNAYAYDIGLAYQITDDLLDIEGDEQIVGKAINKDNKLGKATFASLLGLERARSQVDILTEQAIKHLEIFGEKGDLLAKFSRSVVDRQK